MQTNTQLLTPRQVATYLQVDIATVYRHLNTGELPGVKVGRVWRIHPDVLERYTAPVPFRPEN